MKMKYIQKLLNGKVNLACTGLCFAMLLWFIEFLVNAFSGLKRGRNNKFLKKYYSKWQTFRISIPTATLKWTIWADWEEQKQNGRLIFQ